MNIDSNKIKTIRDKFSQINTTADFVDLLNLANKFRFGDKAILFSLKQVTYHAFIAKNRYTLFPIKKKDGSQRTIHAPIKGLALIQKSIAFVLNALFQPSPWTLGFVWRKSIVDNARIHAGMKYVYNIDLKDFFHSIDQARIWGCLKLKPFNLNNIENENWSTNSRRIITNNNEIVPYKISSRGVILLPDKKGLNKKYLNRIENQVGEEKGDLSQDEIRQLAFDEFKEIIFSESNIRTLQWSVSNRASIAKLISALCCEGLEVNRTNELGENIVVNRRVLPQGAPTSPILSNVVCQRLDRRLHGLAKRFGINYSRYADDITFSSASKNFSKSSEFQQELKSIIASQGFTINDKKTRLQARGYRQEVTGLIVNEQVNVKKEFVQELRLLIYLWERYGAEKTSKIYSVRFPKKNTLNSNLEEQQLAKIICGKLDFLKMVKGHSSNCYLKLKNRYDVLIGKKVNVRISAKSKLPKFGSPYELVSYLKHFSYNESSLKYATHSWSQNNFQNLNEFLRKCKQEYSEISHQIRRLSPNLNGKIYAFLFNKNVAERGWGTYRVKYGWSSPHLLNEMSTSHKGNPDEIILPPEFQIEVDNKVIHYFRDIVELFKKEIEVRGNMLEDIIRREHKRLLADFERPHFLNMRGKEFYSDVQWLKAAVERILMGISHRKEISDAVKYEVLDQSDNRYVLIIEHQGSLSKDKSIRDEKFRASKGDLGEILKILKNLCDWSIESEFQEGFHRLNYLVSNKKIPFIEKISPVLGFRHRLTFYL